MASLVPTIKSSGFLGSGFPRKTLARWSLESVNLGGWLASWFEEEASQPDFSKGWTRRGSTEEQVKAGARKAVGVCW